MSTTEVEAVQHQAGKPSFLCRQVYPIDSDEAVRGFCEDWCFSLGILSNKQDNGIKYTAI